MTLFPGETKIIKTTAVGPAVQANRPITSSILFTEGFPDYETRTLVNVYPSLNVIGHKNRQIVSIAIKNTSSVNKIIGKGTKIAQCYSDFVELTDREGEIGSINSVTANPYIDPVEVMCKR